MALDFILRDTNWNAKEFYVLERVFKLLLYQMEESKPWSADKNDKAHLVQGGNENFHACTGLREGKLKWKVFSRWKVK